MNPFIAEIQVKLFALTIEHERISRFRDHVFDKGAREAQPAMFV
jgi:hypothetical protein